MVFLEGGKTIGGTLGFGGREGSIELSVDAEPLFVAIDPGANVLAELTITEDERAFVRQATSGPTLYARMQAVRALSKVAAGVSDEVLTAISLDASQPVAIRLEAYNTWAKRQPLAGVLAPLGSDRWELREARAERLGELSRSTDPALSQSEQERLAKTLIELSSKDTSLKVRCAAIRAMGKLRSPELNAIISESTRMESHTDAYRMAGIDAAVELESQEAMGWVAALCEPKHFARTRGAAVEAVSKLAKQDPDLALAVMNKHLNDRVLRVQRAAGEGMVRLKDARGIAMFDRAIVRERSLPMRRQIERWQEQLGKDVQAMKSTKEVAAPPTK